MKANGLDREGTRQPAAPSAPEWLHIVGARVGLVFVCALWTFWTNCVVATTG